MKKLLSTLLALMLVVTFLSTGCSGKVPSSSETSGATAATSATEQETTAKIDPMAKYDPPVSVKYARLALIGEKFPEGTTYENNVWTQEYLSELGIKLETVWSGEGTEAYDTKLKDNIKNNLFISIALHL